jgi:hypothetical protein
MGLLTPYLGKIALYFGKAYLTSYAKQKIREQLVNFIRKTFGESLVQGMAFFMMHLIEKHWSEISGTTSIKHIAQFIMKKLFKRD